MVYHDLPMANMLHDYKIMSCSTLHAEVVTAAARGPSTSRRSNGSCQWTAETPWLHNDGKLGLGKILKHPVGIIICFWGLQYQKYLFKKRHRNVRNIRSFHCFVSLAKNQKEPSEMSAGCVARLLQRSGENMLRVLTTVLLL